MGEEEMKEMILQEENAIKNQIILFINRMINMRTPLEFAGTVPQGCGWTVIPNYMTHVQPQRFMYALCLLFLFSKINVHTLYKHVIYVILNQK